VITKFSDLLGCGGNQKRLNRSGAARSWKADSPTSWFGQLCEKMEKVHGKHPLETWTPTDRHDITKLQEALGEQVRPEPAHSSLAHCR
jgi:hypothetical protein